MESKTDYLKRMYNLAALKGLCVTKKEFARLLGVNDKGLSAAMNGDPRNLTDSLVKKVELFASANGLEGQAQPEPFGSLLVIPYGARGGTLQDFSQGVRPYECERIVSPIREADYAMEVTGDSMSPEYPSGSRIIIKKVNSEDFIEWGKVYVLDTDNGPVIKQIRKTADPHVVECVSLNPAYQTFTVRTDLIRGWYRVLMVMALK